MNFLQYLRVVRTLFHRVPGPVGIVWGLCTAGKLWVVAAIYGAVVPPAMAVNDTISLGPIFPFAPGSSTFLPYVPPSPLLLIGFLLTLWVLHAFQRALYGSMRHLARSDENLRLGAVVGSAASRMGAVMTVQFLNGVLLTCALVVYFWFGAFDTGMASIFIYFLCFSLAPAVYFVAARRDGPLQAIARSVDLTRRYWPFVLGIPAIFLFLWTLVGSILNTDPGLTFFFILYSYLLWIATSSVYVALDRS